MDNAALSSASPDSLTTSLAGEAKAPFTGQSLCRFVPRCGRQTPDADTRSQTLAVERDANCSCQYGYIRITKLRCSFNPQPDVTTWPLLKQKHRLSHTRTTFSVPTDSPTAKGKLLKKKRPENNESNEGGH